MFNNAKWPEISTQFILASISLLICKSHNIILNELNAMITPSNCFVKFLRQPKP